MVLAAFAAALAIQGQIPAQQAPDQLAMRQLNLTRPGTQTPYLLIQENTDPLDPPMFSPKKFGIPAKPWEFEWISRALPYFPSIEKYALRFRVYSQIRKEKDDLGVPVARMLSAMWSEMYDRVKADHSERYNGKIVDVFLCWGGQAGGEQRFDVMIEKQIKKSVNTIYIYDINSFTDPVEKAREVAHEYGHAELPAIGGYAAPEGWANGYLGEKLFLKWLSEGLADGRLTTEDSMGATKERIDAWLAAHEQPLVIAAAQTFPSAALLKDTSSAGMDRYIGLALLASEVLPNKIFWDSLLFTGSTEAKDYPSAVLMAAADPDEYEVTIPAYLANKPIWLPLGKGHLMGGKILKSQSGWAQVEAPEGKLTVKNR